MPADRAPRVEVRKTYKLYIGGAFPRTESGRSYLVHGADGIGILLTGMGKDGAKGLAQMRNAGAATACQDEATSAIYGMPRAAMAIGAAEVELPLNRIAAYILERSSIDSSPVRYEAGRPDAARFSVGVNQK